MANISRGYRRIGWVVFGAWELVTLISAATLALRWYNDPYRGGAVPVTGNELHKALWWVSAAIAGPILAFLVLRVLLWVREGFNSTDAGPEATQRLAQGGSDPIKLIASALIVACGLAAMGYFIGGRYTIIPYTPTNAVSRLDRLTGEVSLCVPGMSAGGCGFVMEKPAAKQP